MLHLSDSSHTSSPPSGSKPVSNCRLIPLLSTPVSLHGHSPAVTGPSLNSIAQHTPKNNGQSALPHSDLSSVLKGQCCIHSICVSAVSIPYSDYFII